MPPVAVAVNATFSGVFPLVGLALHDTIIVVHSEHVIVGHFIVPVFPCVYVIVMYGLYVPWLLYM